MANTRIMSNNTGHDRTGIKRRKWEQARECLVDPCVSLCLPRMILFDIIIMCHNLPQFWFAGLNAFLSSVPNGGLTTFGR